MFKENKKYIVITGGLGYIGSHAVVGFEQAGYHTIIVDNCSNSNRIVLEGIKKILGYLPIWIDADIGNLALLREVLFSKYKIDGVIHFAGYKAVGESCNEPFKYYENNVVQTISLFQLMEEYGVKRIIFSSSATVHDPDYAPNFSEKTPMRTVNPYGTTKLIIEHILSDLTQHKSWQAVSLRYFNPIGSHQSGAIGESPIGVPNNLLPYVLDVVTNKREYVCIYGDDYETRDGTGVRDYIDVCDLIDAHILAYNRLTTNTTTRSHEIICLGTGGGTSVYEILKIVGKVIGKDVPYKVLPRREGDIGEFYVSSSKAFELLGWQPKTSISTSITNSLHYRKLQ